MHACNPSTLGGRGRQISEFKASLVYRVSSRTARDIQRNLVSKKTKIQKPKTKTTTTTTTKRLRDYRMSFINERDSIFTP